MITKEQALNLSYREEIHAGTCAVHVGPRGGETWVQERWRVNGKVKVWATRPTHFAVPIKYGLNIYGYLEHHNAYMFHLASECQPIRRDWKGREIRDGNVS